MNIRSIVFLLTYTTCVAMEQPSLPSVHQAAFDGDIVRVQELLKSTPVDEQESTFGATPLIIASENGHAEVVKLLLAAGADKDKAMHGGTTPLYIASFNGHAEVVKLLLAAGVDKDKARQDGTTPLYAASEYGHAEVVKLLLAAGAGKDKANQYGTTSLYIASQQGHAEVVKLLLAAGADKDKAELYGLTPLWAASFNGHAEVVKLLLAAGVDKDKAEQGGTTPLYMASEYGHAEVVKLLLAAGADKDKARQDGATPLWAAISRLNEDSVKENADLVKRAIALVKMLVNEGASINAAVRELLPRASDDIRNYITNAPHTVALLQAAEENNLKQLLAAIKGGADVNAARCTRGDNTPLHMAARNENVAMTIYLLCNGADPRMRNCEGQMAMQLAHEVPTLKAFMRAAGLSPVKEEVLQVAQLGLNKAPNFCTLL